MKKKDRSSEREDQDRIERLLKIAFNTQLQQLKSLKTATKMRRALKRRPHSRREEVANRRPSAKPSTTLSGRYENALTSATNTNQTRNH